jgi:hypothetical protein
MAIAPRAGDSPAPGKAVSKRHAAAPRKNGRPSSYTEATAAEICRRVVEGQSLRTICKAPGMPDKETIANWRRAHPEFDKRYQDARCDQADMHVEEMLDVARQAVNAKSSQEVQGYKLLVDTLKWRASKMKPRSYGDKITLDGELAVRSMSDQEINARIAYLLNQARKPELALVAPIAPPIEGDAA